MPDRAALDLVSLSLEYPDETVTAALAAAEPDAVSLGTALSEALDGLRAWLVSAGQHQAEESYTRLFDMSPVCTLHAGYHLFGDAYQRGALLASLAAELRLAGVPQRDGELPDFLPTLLRLAGRLPEGEERALLVDFLLLPALTRMNAALAGSPSPWAAVLAALPAALAPLGAGLEAPDYKPVDSPEEVPLHV